ncbi:MAG: PAS-domain containing protein, partial [Rhodospirillales bacterium]|nr:PAS-domain containing protein [Rhodospirillales bacterium]
GTPHPVVTVMLAWMPASLLIRGDHILYGNDAAAKLLSTDCPDGLVGLPLDQFLLTPVHLFDCDGSRDQSPLQGAVELENVGFRRCDGTNFSGCLSISILQSKPVVTYLAVMSMLPNSSSTIVSDAEAHAVHERFVNAMESLDVGFVLWNEKDEFIACNQFFRDIFSPSSDILEPGTPARIFLEHVAKNITTDGENENLADRLYEMPFGRLQELSPREYQLQDRRWFLRRSKRLADGGLMSLHTEISGRKVHELEIEQAKEFAEMASTAKSDFLANMSHELRTPLNAIIGFSEALNSDFADRLPAKSKKDYLEYILVSSQHLLDLINGVLDVSAIEAGIMDISDEVISLSKITEHAFKLVEQRAATGGVVLKNEITSDAPFLVADGTRMKQIFVNLLSNAVKFTPEGGTVSVYYGHDSSGNMEVHFTDTGIGLDDDGIKIARSRFGQVPGSDAEKEGTGLGLPLSINLIERHGGQLDIKSEPGKGTTVTVMIPQQRIRTPVKSE